MAETAQGGVVNALAREGGLDSTFWAGPENITRRMRKGEVAIQGGPRKGPARLRLGFSGEEFGYSISLGLPIPIPSAFGLDPEIERECIWAGPFYRLASLLVDRKGSMIRVRSGRRWVAALLTPRPPLLMVLDEPETSLHPDLLPALVRLIIRASENTQVWVVTHANRLIAALNEHRDCHSIELEKNLGQTQMMDQGLLDEPIWHWPD